MKNIKYLVIISILLLLIVVINSIFFNQKNKIINNDLIPVCKSGYSDTLIYNKEGNLQYRLIAKNIDFFPLKGYYYFNEPTITIYDRNKTPKWIIKSNKAKLTNDYMLYMYTQVEINSFNNKFQIYRVVANNVEVNLITQNITSKNKIIFYSTYFSTITNLNSQVIEL